MASHVLPRDDSHTPGAANSAAAVRTPCAKAVSTEVLKSDAFREQWDALAERASEPNPFYEAWYLLPSIDALDEYGEVQLVTVEQGGELIGLIPLARQRDYYGHPLPQWRNWCHANCFCGAPLVAKGHEAAFWRGLLEWCDDNAGASLFLHLGYVPLGSALSEALAQVTGTDRSTVIVHREERAVLQSDLDPEAYLAQSLSSKKRKELRRQHRRLSEEGELEFLRQSDAAGLDQWIADFLTLEASGWKGEGGTAMASDPAKTDIFTRTLQGAAEHAKLERLQYALDGKPIAMLANFIAPPGAFSYKTAFDEAYSRFSPGVLLQRENLDLLSRPDIAWTDSCAAADHPMIDHFWRERRTIGRINIAIGGRLRRAGFAQIARIEGGERL